MKKFIAICFCFLLGCITNVMFGNDSPTKVKHSFNNECSLIKTVYATVNNFEFSPDRYSGDEFICNYGYTISKKSTALNFNFAIVTDPLTLKRMDTKYKINDRINYKEPFVDKSYVWKYSYQFNC